MRKLMLALGAAVMLGACAPEGPPKVGDRAPDFKLAAVDGGTVALKDFRGSPVLLYFHMAVG